MGEVTVIDDPHDIDSADEDWDGTIEPAVFQQHSDTLLYVGRRARTTDTILSGNELPSLLPAGLIGLIDTVEPDAVLVDFGQDIAGCEFHWVDSRDFAKLSIT